MLAAAQCRSPAGRPGRRSSSRGRRRRRRGEIDDSRCVYVCDSYLLGCDDDERSRAAVGFVGFRVSSTTHTACLIRLD